MHNCKRVGFSKETSSWKGKRNEQSLLVIRSWKNPKLCANNVWCIKYRTKHSSKTVLGLVHFLMNQTLGNWITNFAMNINMYNVFVICFNEFRIYESTNPRIYESTNFFTIFFVGSLFRNSWKYVTSKLKCFTQCTSAWQ